jgi:hypothetical protein
MIAKHVPAIRPSVANPEPQKRDAHRAAARVKFVLVRQLTNFKEPLKSGHCEERSDEAISQLPDEIASLRSQ